VSGVLLLSGGLDSAANLALLSQSGPWPGVALTIDYGQRAARAEVYFSKRLAEHFQVEHQVLELPWLGRLGGSSLTEGTSSVPELRAELLDDPKTTQESAGKVWVPNRNGIFISLASALAERRGFPSVWVGFNQEEAATFPDNSEAYAEAISQAQKFSTRNGVLVRSLTLHYRKTQIVEILRALPRKFPWEWVWSCYHSYQDVEENFRMCGKCESCQRFLRATEGEER
jgi:7-cyano-7-deazaguanine synthase